MHGDHARPPCQIDDVRMGVHEFVQIDLLQNATGRYGSWHIRRYMHQPFSRAGEIWKGLGPGLSSNDISVWNWDVMSTSRSTTRHSLPVQGNARTPTTTSLRVVTGTLKARIPGPSTIQTRGIETMRFGLHGEQKRTHTGNQVRENVLDSQCRST